MFFRSLPPVLIFAGAVFGVTKFMGVGKEQEVVPSPTPTETPSPTPTTEISPNATAAPTETPTESPNITAAPTEIPTPIATPEPTAEPTPTPQPTISGEFIEFADFCVDTCKLPDLKSKKYTIKIVVEGEGQIIIDSIYYAILKKTKIISIEVKDRQGKTVGDYNLTERLDGKFDMELDLNKSESPDKFDFEVSSLQIAKTPH